MRTQPITTNSNAAPQPGLPAENTLNTAFFDHHERQPIRPHGPPEPDFHHWLSVEQIRKMQRMRRTAVLAAMNSGQLPFEQRGRIRYARLSDVLLWEERRLAGVYTLSSRPVHPDLADLA